MVKTMSSFLENSIGIAGPMGGILASLSPWILLTVSVTTIGSFLPMRQNSDWAYRNKGRWLGADRRLAYVRDRSAELFPGQGTCGCTACPAGSRSLVRPAL